MTRRLVSAAALIALWCGAASAQWEWAFVTADGVCDGGQVQLDVTVTPLADPPADLVGWVVERHVVGACVPDEIITAVMPLPNGPVTIGVTDVVPAPERTALYRVMSVDQAGQLQWISWPQRGWFEHVPCAGTPTARGEVRVFDSVVWLDVCPDQCWTGQSMLDSLLPPEWAAYEGVVIDVYGELRQGMEGYYIIPDGMSVPAQGCGDVAAAAVSWSALKGRFR